MQANLEAVAWALSMALLLGSGLVWAAVARRLFRRQPLVALEPRSGAPWSGFDLVVLAIALVFGELAAREVVEGLSPEAVEGVSPEILVALTIARIAWLGFAVVYLVIKRGATLYELGFDASRLAGDARLGGRIFLAAIVPVFAVQGFFVYVLQMPSEHPLLKLAHDEPRVPIMALATLLAVGVAPVFEEFVFRVVLQGWLESQQARLRRLRGGGADERSGFAPLVIASIVFAMLHFGHGPDPIALFVFSLFLGYAYRQTHRIFPSLVIHACLNGWTMFNLWVLFVAER
ncbi:MAG: CPBP family intramembrane glutamic endopeptidase [Pirellulales bacterium]